MVNDDRHTQVAVGDDMTSKHLKRKEPNNNVEDAEPMPPNTPRKYINLVSLCTSPNQVNEIKLCVI